jgi:hypothetical protein
VDPVVGVGVAGVLGGVLVFRRRAIAPGVPRRWRSSQSVAARQCRRLHRAIDTAEAAVRRARRRGVPVVWFEGALRDLHGCATAIDHRLVAAAELPLPARHRTLLALRYRIVEVEKAAGRVVTMAAEAGQPDVDEVRASVRDVHERLDRLEDARRELRDHGTG